MILFCEYQFIELRNSIIPFLVLSCLVLSSLVLSCLVLSCLVLSCSTLSFLVFSCPVLSWLVLYCLDFSCIVLYCLTCLALSCTVLCLLLTCIVLSFIVLSFIVLPCLVLYCLALLYLVLSCLALSFFVLSSRDLSCMVLSWLFLYCLVLLDLSCIVLTYLVLSCLVLFCPDLSCLVVSTLDLYCFVLSFIVLSCIVLSCLALPCLVLSCIIFSCPVLSCLVLSLYLVLSCFALSFLVLSCRDLSCIASLPCLFFSLLNCSISSPFFRFFHFLFILFSFVTYVGRPVIRFSFSFKFETFHSRWGKVTTRSCNWFYIYISIQFPPISVITLSLCIPPFLFLVSNMGLTWTRNRFWKPIFSLLCCWLLLSYRIYSFLFSSLPSLSIFITAFLSLYLLFSSLLLSFLHLCRLFDPPPSFFSLNFLFSPFYPPLLFLLLLCLFNSLPVLPVNHFLSLSSISLIYPLFLPSSFSSVFLSPSLSSFLYLFLSLTLPSLFSPLLLSPTTVHDLRVSERWRVWLSHRQWWRTHQYHLRSEEN